MKRYRIRDYTPLLNEAIADAKAAGFAGELQDLEAQAICPFTTASEMCQEHGLAIARFLRATRGRLPKPIVEKLKACLNETRLAMTGMPGFIANLRRSPLIQ